ncbi:hypothetical protein GCM10020216_092130 [Nonomuraea helvata]
MAIEGQNLLTAGTAPILAPTSGYDTCEAGPSAAWKTDQHLGAQMFTGTVDNT